MSAIEFTLTEARAAIALYFEPLKWFFSAFQRVSARLRDLLRADFASSSPGIGELTQEIGRVIHSVDADKPTVVRFRALAELAALGGDSKTSAMILTRALRHFARIGDSRAIAVLWLDIAAMYSRSGDLDKAEHSVLRAIKMSETLHNHQLLAAALVNLGWIRQTQDNRGQAAEYYLKALEFLNEPDSSHIAATAYSNLAEINFRELRLEDASQNLTKAIQLEESAGRYHVLVQSYMRLALILEMLGDWENSRRSMMRAKELWQEHTSQPSELITTLLK